MIITPEPYKWPIDGYDICQSCDYLELVHTTCAVGDGATLVPLCKDCATKLGEN